MKLSVPVPPSLRGYQRSWLTADVVAGVTLAAVVIPEVMGYTSIAQTPLQTGLYTVIFPTMVFALLASSRLLVVGADSATAAVLAAGLTGLGVQGLTPNSPEWVAWCSLTALVCGGMLLLARILKLGFIGDFLSASVLIGFLTGVGVQVLSGQVPDMLGVPKPSGGWLEQQWRTIQEVGDTSLATFAFAAGTVLIVVACKRFVPKVPGALVAVVGSIVIAAATDAGTHGVSLIGSVPSGPPPIGLPSGLTWSDAVSVVPIAFSCFVLVIAQSAATSRSHAARRGERVDVDQDILGLSAANVAAGFSGTFVVNGSPTKTEMLDEQRGRTQVANLTMSLVVLVFALFLTGMLADMPRAVLASIVFLIGMSLVDIGGMRVIARQRSSEFVVAVLTALTVVVVGVEEGIVVAVVASVVDVVRRAYKPREFVVRMADDGTLSYTGATPGTESEPGLLVVRYDAQLFYANAGRFADDVQALVTSAPHPVRWVVLDCSSLDDVDYSAGAMLRQLDDFVHGHGAHVALARVDPAVIENLRTFGVLDQIRPEHVYGSLQEAIDAFRRETAPA